MNHLKMLTAITKRSRFLLGFFAAVFICLSSNAQTSAPGIKDSFHFQSHFNTLYAQSAKQYAFKGNSKDEFLRWQKSFLPQLKQNLGLTLMEQQLRSFKPYAQKRETQQKDGYVLERWVLWTEPTAPLPFVLLKPQNKTGKLPLVLTPHGHGKNTEAYAGVYSSEEDRKFNEDGQRDVAVQAVKQGYLAIAPTVRAFGETRSAEDLKKNSISSCDTQLMQDLLVGRTPIGERVWDISRLIDWALKTLPVQEQNIIVTGNSGGGTVSLFAAACEPRISIAIPASYFCTFEQSIGSIEHCECNYVPGMLQLGEMADVAGLIAPRAFCAVNGVEDPIFPIAGVRTAFSNLQKIYKAAGVANNCALYEGNGGHRYYSDGAWPFVKLHLK